MTPDEISFVNYANALADWLEPYHDHARPPPSVVLAEAAKLAESKTGHPLKGVETPPKGNGTSNGSTKKDEEAPAVTEAPEIVVRYFDGMKITDPVGNVVIFCVEMKIRFEAVKDASSPSLTLHVATLMQEVNVSVPIHRKFSHLGQAFLLFIVETIRFKTPSIVKVHKLGAVSNVDCDLLKVH